MIQCKECKKEIKYPRRGMCMNCYRRETGLSKSKSKQISQHKYNDLCVRCKKNPATMTYAVSVTDWTHGHGERICQECYDKQKKESAWYIEGKKCAMQEEMKFLRSLLQTRSQKDLSQARTQDTHRATIPDMYDNKIKERIIHLKLEGGIEEE